LRSRLSFTNREGKRRAREDEGRRTMDEGRWRSGVGGRRAAIAEKIG